MANTPTVLQSLWKVAKGCAMLALVLVLVSALVRLVWEAILLPWRAW